MTAARFNRTVYPLMQPAPPAKITPLRSNCINLNIWKMDKLMQFEEGRDG